MAKARIPETSQGIQGEFHVAIFDQLQRRLRDRGTKLESSVVSCNPIGLKLVGKK